MLKIPHLVAPCLLLFSAAGAAAQGRSAPDTAGVGAVLDEHLRRLVPFGFNGVLLVVRDGRTLVRGGYGMADLESGRPFTPGTPFYIGSLTKQFTAAGILRLEMEGRLQVTDSIGRFLPGVPQDKRGITLHHLLTHSGGLPGDPPGGVDGERDREAAVREILEAPLRRAPGTSYAYSNGGYVLLAAVIEAAAGVPYEQYLRDKLWTPAGMTHTGYRPRGMETVAVGYRGGTRWGTPMERHIFPDGPTWSMRGAGGMLSTLDDLHAWSRALDGESVLSAEARGKLWAPHVPENPRGTSHYGYGWSIRRTSRGTPLVWHNGSNGFYYAEVRRYTDEGVLVIGASNVAESSVEAPVGAAARLIFGLPVTPPPLTSPADPARAAAAAGRYRLPTGGTITAAAEAGGLRLTTEGADAFAAVRGSPLSAEAQQAGARTVAALDAANRDDFAPLHQALGAEMPVEALRAMYLDNMESPGLGAASSVELVGTLPEGSRSIVIVRVRMERGDVLLRLEWEGERLGGIDMMPAPRPIAFLPAPDGSWVSYAMDSGATVRLRINGAVMEIETTAGLVRATRS